MKQSILDRILIDPNTGCWIWQCSGTADGYACAEFPGGMRAYPHRVSYREFVGEIPENMSIDHICKNRKCCNPKHLQVLSIKENILLGSGVAAKNSKKTHCDRGHAFNEFNTRIAASGKRSCKVCKLITSAKRKLEIEGGSQLRHRDVLSRINAKLTPANNGCLLWSGTHNGNGHGKILVNNKLMTVHKVVYEENNGKIPNGFNVYRKCENTLCCAVDHLYILPSGTVPSKIILIK